jgi:hypothetical protein
MRSLLLAVATVLLATSAAGAPSVTRLELHAFGVTRSELVIEVEEPVLVPSLAKVPLTDDALAGIVPYPQSEQGGKMREALAKQKNLTLGHTAVYFYIAVNQALSRIFQNRLFGQGSMAVDKALSEDIGNLAAALGRDEAVDGKAFANLRELVGLKPIDGLRIRLQVFFDKSEFDREAAEIGLHSASAFWDPDRLRLGILFNARLMKWYREQAGTEHQAVATTAQNARDYVVRQTIDLVSHELVHLIQHANGRFLANRPFLAEAAALLVQSNISRREDVARLAQEHLQRGLSLTPPRDSPCNRLLQLGAPFNPQSLVQFQRGIEVARSGREVGQVMLMSNPQFYAQGAQALQSDYDMALAFSLFIGTLSRSEFAEQVQPALARSGASPGRAQLARLSAGFRQWAERHATEWWDRPGADQHFEAISMLVSICMAERHYITAYTGISAMFQFRPRSSRPHLYWGDVYWRLGVPFFAYDLYALSHAWRAKYGLQGESSARIDSRLGDAFEIMGDIDSAIERFDALKDVKSSPGFEPTLARTRLKGDFYHLARQRGFARHDLARMVLNTYVAELQGGQCASPEDKAQMNKALEATGKGDHAEVAAILDARYRKVSAKMKREIAEGSIDAIAAKRRNCST